MSFWLIETEEQLEQFKKKNYTEIFIEPIYYNDRYHSILNEVCAIYVRPISHKKGYILNINHTDGLHLDKNLIKQFLKDKTIYLRDKKSILYHFSIKHAIDISFNTPEYTEHTTNSHLFYYYKFSEKHDVNNLIPIVKHYEKCEQLFLILEKYFTKEVNTFFNEKATLAFLGIEKNGIKINTEILQKYFEPTNESYSIQNNIIYTKYNLYTTTRRPSNTFNNINFAALKKDNKCREAFIPQNDEFIEIDISAYHPTLAGQLVNYNFGEFTPYQWFAESANLKLEDAKILMFKQLYGGIYEEYQHLDFFIKIKEYIDNLWNKFNSDGFIECPISKYKFEKALLPDMNPQKLFNYLLQCLETSNNINIIWNIIKILRGKNTKIILYTYDSFTFDVDNDELVIDEIKQIFTQMNLKIKTKHGRNFTF
jgi:hypothetical protein